MRIDIMTLFPDTVGDMMNESILGRAQERDIIRIEAHQIRDYTLKQAEAGGRLSLRRRPRRGHAGRPPLPAAGKHICDDTSAPGDIPSTSPPAARNLRARKTPGRLLRRLRPYRSWCAATMRASTSGSLTSAWTRRFPSAISSSPAASCPPWSWPTAAGPDGPRRSVRRGVL